MSGFWGTPREDQWRRRKDREMDLMNQVRSEEQRIKANVVASYKRQLEERDQVLTIARGLLGDARYDARAAKRTCRRSEEDEDGAATGEVAGSTGGDANVEQIQSEEAASASAQPRVKTETDDTVPESTTSMNSTCNSARAKQSDDEEDKATQSVREHLLALPYAMFDTLYGTGSFNPRSFAAFLMREGERALAEEIALAAVEKTQGDPDAVRYVLEDLVPGSVDAEALPGRLEAILSDDGMKSEGKKELMKWQIRCGNTKAAFEAALLMENEYDRLNAALPLAASKEQRDALKESCSTLLDKKVLSVFKEYEWHGFFLSILPVIRPEGHWGRRWKPPFKAYISYAANSMDGERGAEVAWRMVRQMSHQKLQLKKAEDATNPYRHEKYGSNAQVEKEKCLSNLRTIRDESCDQTLRALTELRTIFDSPVEDPETDNSLQQNLNKLGIHPYQAVAAQISSELGLPSKSECTTSHGTFRAIFGCRKCRLACISLAIEIGVVRALRRFDISDPFSRLGFSCRPDELVEAASPGSSGEIPAIVKFLLGDDLSTERYCAPI